MHLAALGEVEHDLLPALRRLAGSLEAKASEFDDVVKSGRHAPDGCRCRSPSGRSSPATRRRCARESSGSSRAQAARPDPARRHRRRHRPQHASGVRCQGARAARRRHGLHIPAPADPFEAQAARDGLVEAFGRAEGRRRELTKIANDLRLMGSGRARPGGALPARAAEGQLDHARQGEPGHPGGRHAGGAQVIGNDQAITVGGLQGHFELNVFVPMMARNLLDSIKPRRRLAPPGREVRRRARGQPRAERALRGAHPLRRDGAQPAYRATTRRPRS